MGRAEELSGNRNVGKRWQRKGNKGEKLDGCGKEGMRSGFGAWKNQWDNAALIVSLGPEGSTWGTQSQEFTAHLIKIRRVCCNLINRY